MSDTVDLSMRQFAEAWRAISLACPAHRVLAAAGVEYLFSGLPIPFFNVAMIQRRGVCGAALRGTALEAKEWAAGTDVPWFLAVTHEALDRGVDAVAVLDECGMVPAVALTGMIAGRVGEAPRVPDGLEMGVPPDDDGCAAFVSVNSAAYGMPLEASEPVLGKRQFWQSHHGVVGKVDGQPVSCAAVMMVEGCRYVGFVATDPAHQRRGYAGAVMRRALEEAAAAHGDKPTVLHATEAGRPVYERMGYAAIATHGLFIEKRFVEGH